MGEMNLKNTKQQKYIESKFTSIKALLDQAKQNGNKKVVLEQQKKAEVLKEEAQESKPAS
jgi:hypothetical protein